MRLSDRYLILGMSVRINMKREMNNMMQYRWDIRDKMLDAK
jgi:hypothetical protein